LNPALGLNIREFGHGELERFKNWLYAEILKPGFPEGNETVGIFDIKDRKTCKAAFTKLPDTCGRFAPRPDFFNALRMIDGMEIFNKFEEGGGPWLVVCQLQKGVSWKDIKANLTAKASEIPLEKRYNLSADSRALLQWILDLHSNEYLLGMTPPVEDHIENDIGFKTELEDENVRSYIELLLEEINEKTEYNLRTIAWHHYSHENTRILVHKKRAGFEEIVRAVQVRALSKNKLLDKDKVKAAIRDLIGED
jgi:hypothetical protein